VPLCVLRGPPRRAVLLRDMPCVQTVRTAAGAPSANHAEARVLRGARRQQRRVLRGPPPRAVPVRAGYCGRRACGVRTDRGSLCL